MNVATVDNVSVLFGGLSALTDVSLAVAGGERRAVIGPNGAGKTTLFNAIAGSVRITSGRVLLGAQEMTRLPVHERARLGVARTFQITNLLPRLTAIDNVLLALQASERSRHSLFGSMRRHTELYRRGDALLGQWSLDSLRDIPVMELAYGDQRKLEIVMALARSPKLLLLDEPAAGLAKEETAVLAELLKQLPRNVTVIFIEHDLDMAFDVADRITVLHQGRVIAEGVPDAIRKDARVGAIYIGKAI